MGWKFGRGLASDPSVPRGIGEVTLWHPADSWAGWKGHIQFYYLPGALVGEIVRLGSAIVVPRSICMWTFQHGGLSMVKFLM